MTWTPCACAASSRTPAGRARRGTSYARRACWGRPWRGAPLADVGLSGARPGGTARFEECYLTAQERLADLDAATGRYERSLQVLPGLLADWPLRESLWVRLLRILHACGRRAEALERYEQARALFVGRFGTEPGAALQAVFDDLLAQSGPR